MARQDSRCVNFSVSLYGTGLLSCCRRYVVSYFCPLLSVWDHDMTVKSPIMVYCMEYIIILLLRSCNPNSVMSA